MQGVWLIATVESAGRREAVFIEEVCEESCYTGESLKIGYI